MDEKLIILVQREECLYNLSHKLYSDSVVKTRLWQKIGEELGLPGIECKQRWFSLRDQYRRSVKGTKVKSGQAATKYKPWKYEKEMSFLHPYFQERETLSSVSEVADDFATRESHETHLSEDPDTPEKAPEPAIPGTSRLRKRKAEEKETASAVLMKRLLDSEQPQLPRHPIDALFQGVAETVKTFTPRDQYLFKAKVLQLMVEFEGKYYPADSEEL